MASCYHTDSQYSDQRQGDEFEEVLTRLQTMLTGSVNEEDKTFQLLNSALYQIRTNKNQHIESVTEEKDNAPVCSDVLCMCGNAENTMVPDDQETVEGNNNSNSTRNETLPNETRGAKCTICRLEKVRLQEAEQGKNDLIPEKPTLNENLICDDSTKNSCTVSILCEPGPPKDSSKNPLVEPSNKVCDEEKDFLTSGNHLKSSIGVS